MTPIQAMRAKCMDCTCNQPKEIRLCTMPDCALFPFRMGRNPNRAHCKGPDNPFFGRNA